LWRRADGLYVEDMKKPRTLTRRGFFVLQ